MASSTEHAKQLMIDWKGENFAFGAGSLKKTGAFAREYGTETLIVSSGLERGWINDMLSEICESLDGNGVFYTVIPGSKPNSPREDVYRIAIEIAKVMPDSIIALGGGSTIDAVKASAVLAAYSTEQVEQFLDADISKLSTVEPFLGMGLVTKIAEATAVSPLPIIAVETVSSSAAHLTKYSNITDPLEGQKKLIIDMAIVPPKAVFDYDVTVSSSKALTLDGGLDGISHMWEVFMGASGRDFFDQVADICATGMELIVNNLPKAVENPDDLEARTALGLGTDLGGYAIMVGGTNGGHLGSFSLVDLLAHGRACAVLNPYYTVLFSSAIQKQLAVAGRIFHGAGYMDDPSALSGRELGEAVANGMLAFSKSIEFPATLSEAGATQDHIERMLSAAKNPQLASKLMNMPVPMDSARGDIDTYMRPTLEAALSGDFSSIPVMEA